MESVSPAPANSASDEKSDHESHLCPGNGLRDFTLSGDLKPIAIVGMACRFPKGLESIESLWNALKTRFSAIDFVPPDRWSVDRYYSSNPIAKGKSYIKRGGFLTQNITEFDASFFGITPRDAENMDPQQRLLLEVVWEAFENSGMILPNYSGRQVGVYVGGFMLDHMISQMSAPNRSAINQNTAAGMMMTMLSNRISHTFDFRGPSLSIDTACSSSLVAFHYACQDLWRGQSEMAIVGGANVMLRPEYPMGMCKGHFLSRDGECKSFDARGDGYGRGEGAGAILLKPLESAIQDGDHVLATVIGTGCNQDGRTPGISMPSGDAQRDLIQQVCNRYEIDPSSIAYVECHGTGTAIGDPTESKAIGSVYGAARKNKGLSPVFVGSIKSNIGHLEAAAGVAGVIKATLTTLYKQTTPLANLQEINSEIALDSLHIRLSNELIELDDTSIDLRVAINSFGYGGTNAHVILQSAPASTINEKIALPGEALPCTQVQQPPFLLPISARSDQAVADAAGKYAKLLEEGYAIHDIIYSAANHRAHLSHRAVAKGDCRQSLIEALSGLSLNGEHPNVVRGTQPFVGIRKPVFVYTGMGPQWWAMGQELYRQDSIYRAAVDYADLLFQEIAGFSILQEMQKDESTSQITRTELAQPANFMIQIGLTASLKAAGVTPGAVVGHSVGELGSAFAAGVLSLRDALAVCFHRSRLQATCKGTGGMLAVGLSKELTLARLAHVADRVSIAAVNGPTNVTIAGEAGTIQSLSEELTRDNIFNKLLDVEVPYHSPMMDPILEDLKESLVRISPNLPQLPIYSTVTGRMVNETEYGDEYWPRNVRQPVEFASAIASLLNDGFTHFLEVGPHPVLANSIKDCIKEAGKDCRQAYTLRRNMPEIETLHRAIMYVFADGCDLDWIPHAQNGKRISLPNYSWQRNYYWVENDRAKQDRIATIEYPMLGIQEAPGAPVYRNDFDHEPMLYLRDHVVTGMPILPAAGYIESILELASIQFNDALGYAIRDLNILSPMIINAERGLDCVTTYDPASQSATIRSLENGRLGTGQVHVTAKLAGLKRFRTKTIDLKKIVEELPVVENVDEFYKGLHGIGLSYGPAFQSIKKLFTNDSAQGVLARVEMQAELTGNLNLYCLHPTVLDACFQSLMVLLKDSETTFLPTGFGELCVYARNLPSEVWCFSECINKDKRNILCNLTVTDNEGNILASLRSMRLTAASKRERIDRFGDRVKRQILEYQWSYGEALTEPKRLGYWLVVGDESSIAQNVIQQLQNYGAVVTGVARFGNGYGVDGSKYILRSGSAEDAKKMLANLGELDGVVFLDGLSATIDSTDPTAETAITSLIGITQGVIETNAQRKPRFYVVTRGAFAINNFDTSVQPGQTALNGFVRVAFNELDSLRFSSIDLPNQMSSSCEENLVLELLCDADQDEVALRGTLRLYSELRDSELLSADRIEPKPLDDDHPVLVRPLRPDFESVGTARVLETQANALKSEDIHLRIETTIIPDDLLNAPSSETIQQPVIEVVGRILAVGDAVTDLTPGMRVCGFAPTDLSSHMTGKRGSFFLVSIPESIAANDLTSVLGTLIRAERACEAIGIGVNRNAIVFASDLGVQVANGLRRKGYRVSLLVDTEDMKGQQIDRDLLESYPRYSACPEGIAEAISESSNNLGFDVVAVPLRSWQTSFDFNMLRIGGNLLDLDDCASAVSLPKHATGVVRTDMNVLMQNPKGVEDTLRVIVDLLGSGTIAAEPSLDVSISDLAWQKLPLADTSAKMILNYEMRGNDLPVVQQDRIAFDPNATYLVTGGFGGFGQKTAEWIVENGARHLVLTGRTGADNEARKEFVTGLEKRGVQVTPAACDTSDFDRLKELITEIQNSGYPLKGVYHSGALIIDQPIAEIDMATFQKVMRSKALGAWNLHLLTKDIPLEQFVLYSSIANLVGNSRQSAYSSANGFLNGLAHLRHSMGLAGTSVNWGAISDVGVVAQDEKLEQFLRYTGLRGISSEEGLGLLKTGLSRDVPQFGVTIISSWADWARFETRGATSPRFASLIAADSDSQDHSTRDALIEELSKLDPTDQVELLASLIIEIIASVLKSDPSNIPMDKSLNQLGVDSLMATEIQQLLDTQLGLSVSILELIGDSSIRILSAQSLKNLKLVSDTFAVT